MRILYNGPLYHLVRGACFRIPLDLSDSSWMVVLKSLSGRGFAKRAQSGSIRSIGDLRCFDSFGTMSQQIPTVNYYQLYFLMQAMEVHSQMWFRVRRMSLRIQALHKYQLHLTVHSRLTFTMLHVLSLASGADIPSSGFFCEKIEFLGGLVEGVVPVMDGHKCC
ncbi:hypothetical protein MLD38_010418 [Melastoma candidum]|uniref:Uncharacterized protein n=1 Tax=Melastoma candidum TaxID=119954 RepID=A0ACB9R1K4_9MYRT|nr:hypothetical protein MLD38_010418 [Melastoma candidum]